MSGNREQEIFFEDVSNADLMRRMQRAGEFGHEESQELTRRLGAVGLSWKWTDTKAGKYVEILGAESANEVRGYD